MHRSVLVAAACLIAAFTAGADPTSPGFEEFAPISRLHQQILQRFETLGPFGMSRIARIDVVGKHFPQSAIGGETDYQPLLPDEVALWRQLNSEGVRIGFYVFGRAAAWLPAAAEHPRAMKGPAVVTEGTKRPIRGPFVMPPRLSHYRMPKSYAPSLLAVKPPPDVAPSPDRLPEWSEAYPVAQAAWRTFEAGQDVHEQQVDQWVASARAVRATQVTCVQCHMTGPGHVDGGGKAEIAIGDALGGFLYLYRYSRVTEPERRLRPRTP